MCVRAYAALSQATFIHVRNGRKPIDHSVFNEAYQVLSNIQAFKDPDSNV
jgi:arginine/lysine/ornithine decarboxylase